VKRRAAVTGAEGTGLNVPFARRRRRFREHALVGASSHWTSSTATSSGPSRASPYRSPSAARETANGGSAASASAGRAATTRRPR
jgi:hypothetical protein